MKRIFIQMLPIMAAILLATSCSKDDGGNAVIDNVVAQQEEPIQESVETSVRKTITITGKVSQTSLSKVGVSETEGKKTLTFVGDEVFRFSNGVEGDKAVTGSIEIKKSTGEYEASFSFDESNESALTSTSFTATLNEHAIGLNVDDPKDNLADAVSAACYAINFTVSKNEAGVYKMKSGDASDIVVNIESAFIHPQANGWITVSGKSYQVTGNKYYVVSNKSKMGAKNAIEAGKIYNVSNPAAEKTVPDGYVDLGIVVGNKKVFWAEKNVGATNAWDSGDYYAWGEIEPYYADGHAADNPCSNWRTIAGRTITGYNWATYSGFDGDNNGSNFTQYKDEESATLSSDDDAATKNFDSESSMPTTDEWQELAKTSNCTWEWTSDYAGSKVAGYIVYAGTGTHTLFEAHIFLPAAGYRSGSDLSNAGSYGYYWSSSLYTGRPDYACYLSFYSGYVYAQNGDDRYFGLSVRAVLRK